MIIIINISFPIDFCPNRSMQEKSGNRSALIHHEDELSAGGCIQHPNQANLKFNFKRGIGFFNISVRYSLNVAFM